MANLDRRSMEGVNQRVDDLLLVVTEHNVRFQEQQRQLNARMRRVEMILLASTGAILLLLLSLVAR